MKISFYPEKGRKMHMGSNKKCDGCNRELTKENVAITLSDTIGFWVEVANDGFWFDGEQFCSLECFIGWLRQEVEQLIEGEEATR